MAHRPIFERLPKSWKELDVNGVLERFLGVIDSEMVRVHGKILDLLDLRSINLIPDKYLPLMAPLVGHRWRDDKSHDWNRKRIRFAIHRHSYKGTMTRWEDTAVEHGAQSYLVQDNASTLMILGKQGRLGKKDCYLTGPNFRHEGAFLAFIDPELDYEAFREDVRSTTPSATKWWFQLQDMLSGEAEVEISILESGVEIVGNTRDETVGHGKLGKTFIIHPSGAMPCEESTSPVYWESSRRRIGIVGVMRLGVESYFSDQTVKTSESTSPVYWEQYRDIAGAILGKGKLGVDFRISAGGITSEVVAFEETIVPVGALLTIDSGIPITDDITTIDAGTPDNPLSDEAATVQPGAEES